MKRLFMLVMVLTLTLSAASAFAATSPQGVYLGGKIAFSRVYVDDIDWGGGLQSDGNFSSFGLGAVLGFDFAYMKGIPLRLEAEIMIRTGEDWKKSYGGGYGKFEIDSITTLFANLWFDIAKVPVGGMSIRPFVGLSAGFGVASYESKISTPTYYRSKDGTESALYFGPGGGLRFDLSDRIAVDAMLRYLFSTKYDFDGEKYDAPTLDFNLGLAFKF